MIELTRLNGTPMVLNSDLIKTAEASPDTMLTLINGEKLIVREDTAEVSGARARLPRALVGRASPSGCHPMANCSVLSRSTSLDVSGQPPPPAPPARNGTARADER